MFRTRLLPLSAILLVYAVLAGAYTHVVPLGETPDETEHFKYLQHIALTGELPVMRPVYAENVTIEAHQPPLYYMLGAWLFGGVPQDPAENLKANVCFSFEPDDPGRRNAYFHAADEWGGAGNWRVFRAMRWLSVGFGLITIALTATLAHQLAPRSQALPLVAAAVLAFNPQWLFITASMNNDVPSTCLGAAVLVLAVATARRPTLPRALGLGLLVGAGILTKFSLIAFWPLALAAPALAVWQTQRTIHPRTGWWRYALITFIVPLLVAGWWYWRNWLLYGDPLMWDVTLAAKGAVIAREGTLRVSDLVEFVQLHFETYWLRFGWLNVAAPRWVTYGFLVFTLVGLTGLPRFWRRYQPALDAAIINLLAIGAIYASLLQYIRTINWTGYQGRLAFTAAAPIALLLAAGWVGWLGRRAAWAVAAPLIVAVVGGLFGLVAPAYARPALYTPPAEAALTCARYGGMVQIEGITVAERAAAGDVVPLTVHGFGLAPPAGPATLRLTAVAPDGSIVAQTETPLTWEPGAPWSADLPLPLPGDLAPLRATLAVTVHDTNGPLAAASATGRVLTEPHPVTVLAVGPASPVQPTFATPAAVTYGDVLTLLGYTVSGDGAAVAVTLVWRADAAMHVDYTTFVHLLDANGAIVAQADSQPTAGRYPTGAWAPGDVVVDTKTLAVPAGTEPLTLAIGVYDLATLTRLDAAVNGTTQPDRQWSAPWSR